MDLDHVTFRGPKLDDLDLLDVVPGHLQSLLISLNGFVQFNGGLHIRGACLEPEWHSLRRAWCAPGAFHELYSSVEEDWVPFGEDCVGDQFFLNCKQVCRLSAETGDVEDMGLTLEDFLKKANSDPIEFLSMHPLLQLLEDQGDLPEGFLVHAYPPFCTTEAADGVTLKAIPAWQLHQYHSEMARALPAEGGQIRVVLGD